MTFAETVRNAMNERHLEAKQLAELSGVNAPYISKLLSGKIKEPTWTKACALIEALGFTVDEFREMQTTEELE